jgi:hypothetical protein
MMIVRVPRNTRNITSIRHITKGAMVETKTPITWQMTPIEGRPRIGGRRETDKEGEQITQSSRRPGR